MQEYNSDNDLREQNDNFWIFRIVKYVILVIFVVALLYVSGFFFYRMAVDSTFQDMVLGTIWQQIGTITVAGLAIMGVNKYSKK